MPFCSGISSPFCTSTFDIYVLLVSILFKWTLISTLHKPEGASYRTIICFCLAADMSLLLVDFLKCNLQKFNKFSGG